MPAPTQVAQERVNAFPIENHVLFKHYFEGEDVFERLRPYYNGNEYRFEVPVGEFDSLRRFLFDAGYELHVVDQPERFYVVVPRYSAHPDGIFKRSVRHEVVDDYHAFLLTDLETVDAMVARGAELLTAKPLGLRSESLTDYASVSA
jgi:hypothetical protein